MYIATDNIIALPRQFFVNGRYIGIGGKIIREGGEIIEEGSQDDYEYVFNLFKSQNAENYIIFVEDKKENYVRDTKSNSENSRKRK
jgi:hypothetical protein